MNTPDAIDMNPFPDCAEAYDAADHARRTPVTVLLTPEQLTRLEVLLADLRSTHPALDDNDVTDALFDTGLAAFENMLNLEPFA